jgi:O-antigen ligase
MVVAGAITTAFADYPRLALRELRTLVIEPVLFYFVARAALAGPRDALGLAAAFLGGATAAALLALGQALSGNGLVTAEGVARAAGLYPSPNNLALLLDRAVPLALCLALYPIAGARVAGIGVSGRTVRLAAAAAFAVLSVALIATFSRGAWLASAVAVGVAASPWVSGRPRRVRRRLTIAAGALAVPALLAAAGLLWRVERFRSLLNPQGTGILRLHVWEASLEMVRDFPLWGVGLDQFLYHYPDYMRPEAWREPNLSHPHNAVLDFWLRLGVPGVIALGWIVLRVVRRARAAWPAPGTPSAATVGARGAAAGGQGAAAVQAALIPGVVAALVAAALHGLLDNSYFVVDLAFSTWTLLLVLELASESQEQSIAPKGQPPRPASPPPPGGEWGPGGEARP